MDQPCSKLSWKVPILIALGAVLSLALLFSVEALFINATDFFAAVRAAVPLWIPWLFGAPLGVWLAFRFPFRRREWPLSLTLHILVCAAVVGANQWVSRHYIHPFRAPPPMTPTTLTIPSWGNMESLPVPPPEKKRHPGGGRGVVPMARLAFDVVVYGLLLSICGSVDWARQMRDRERRALLAEAQLAEARLSALRMQLDPHFLFNSLNSVSSLIHSDPAAADNMLGDLSELLRTSLATSSKKEIPLEQELAFIHQYLGIEKIRFRERLKVVENIDPETLNASVPNMLLQPLVENSIKHAMGTKSEPVTIQLDAYRSGSQLCIMVSDDGPGLKPSEERGAGIGLSNTMERLSQLYGSEGRLTLKNRDSGGCIVVVEMPFRSAEIWRA